MHIKKLSKKILTYMAVTASLIAFSGAVVLPFAEVAQAAPPPPMGGRPGPGPRPMPPRGPRPGVQAPRPQSPMKQPPTRPGNPGVRPPQASRPVLGPRQPGPGARPGPNVPPPGIRRGPIGPGHGGPVGMHRPPRHRHHYWIAPPLWYYYRYSDPYYVYYETPEVLPEPKPRLNKTGFYNWNDKKALEPYRLAVSNYSLYMDEPNDTDKQEYLAGAKKNIDKALELAPDNPKINYVAYLVAAQENDTDKRDEYLRTAMGGYKAAIANDATNRDLPMQLAALYHAAARNNPDEKTEANKLGEYYAAASGLIGRDYYARDTRAMTTNETCDFYIHNFAGLAMTQKYSKVKSWGKDVFGEVEGNDKFEIAKEDYLAIKHAKKKERDQAIDKLLFDYVTKLSTDGM